LLIRSGGKMRFLKNDLSYKLTMWFLIFISMIVAVLFCNEKQGFHYDENYSYYSTNVTYGLWPTDNEWKEVDEITSEFVVNEGETLNLGLVKTSQSYDVHPPLYYYVLRVVCFLSKNTFSKWQGLIINLFFYLLCLILLWKIADIAVKQNRLVNLFTILLFGLSAGYLSTITFIRMYSMLTFMCFVLLYIAMKAFDNNQWSFKSCFIPTLIVSCLGFLTHYYYMVFAFFVAAYVCLYLVFHRETRVKAFIYGGSVSVGILLAILYYPVCLSHIFSGYRGTEATQAFMDVSNTWDRINFFTQMLNDFTFSGSFFVLLLIILLFAMPLAYKKKKSAQKADITPAQILLFVVSVGYFLTVCKTGMVPSNPAEALRYECPVYGLVILLVVMSLFAVTDRISKKKIIPVMLLVLAVACQVYGLCNNKVFFLYREDVDNYEWASERADSDVMFIYNPVNSWMIWKDSKELMSYERIFFISMNNEDDITDEEICNSDNLYVYACRSDNSEIIMQKVIDNNKNLSYYEKVGERLFVDIYQLQ